MFEKLFLQILNMSFTASFVILAVIVVRLLLKKAPRVISYALWAVVLFRLICPFSFESAVSLLPINANPIPQGIVYQQTPQINTGIPIVNDSVNAVLSAATPAASMNPLQGWLAIGTFLWLVGIAVLTIYSVVSLLLLKRKLRGAICENENVYFAEGLASPFVMGLFRPKIYLPANLTDNEKRYILLHEQTHIKRLDHVVKIAGFAVLCLHWFNPLAWIAFFLCGKDMEMSCDEAVIKRLGSEIKKEYSSSLLALATGRRIVGGSPLAFGEGDTKSRIKNVLNYRKPAFWMIVVSIIAVVAVGVGLISNPKSEPLPIDAKGVSVEELWGNRTDYVGDNAAVGNIIFNLSFPDNMQYKKFELITNQRPYEIIVNFEGVDDALKTVDEGDNQSKTAWNIDFSSLEENARIMFSLIGNVDKITFSINRDHGGTLTSDFARNKYEELFSKTETLEGFQAVLSELFDTAAPSDYKPAIMINNQIYWLSTDANPDASSGNTWLFGQIKKISPQSAPPSENFEAIGLDPSYVGKDIYISPDGNTLYLDSKAGEKTLQFVFAKAETETTDPVAAAYTMMKIGKGGEVLSAHSLKGQSLARAIVMDALSKSAAWEGVDIDTLDEYYIIRQTFPETDETNDYYAYLLADGKSVLQGGTRNMYSVLSDALYQELVLSFKSNEYLFFWAKPDEPPQYIGNTAAEIWLKSFMGEKTPAENRISDYKITDVTVIAGQPKEGVTWEDMDYQYVVQLTYDITTATEQYLSAGDGISGKGSFQGLFRELCVKVTSKDGGGFQIVAVGTGGGEQEFLIN